MKHSCIRQIAATSGLALFVAACGTASSGKSASSSDTGAAPVAPARAASATAASAASSASDTAGWRPLIDASMSAWRGYKQQTMPDGWRVENGVLMKEKAIGDLVTRDEFANFELAFEWKIGKGGNAGVFYRGNEEFDKIYWTAPEYQLLDDANAADGRSRLTSAASGYALYPAPAGVVKPADEWNSARIVVNGSHVEHWLNGRQMVSFDIGSPDFEAKRKASKFATWAKWASLSRGRLGIQGDHAGALALRDMRIRVLP